MILASTSSAFFGNRTPFSPRVRRWSSLGAVPGLQMGVTYVDVAIAAHDCTSAWNGLHQTRYGTVSTKPGT